MKLTKLMKLKAKTCIIPIAGLGTRCLPLTKVIPKAMLPVAGKPCVQWIVEEVAAAGIKDIIFVYSKGHEMVQEYFAKKTWYDEELKKRGKTEGVKKLEAIRNLAQFQFVEQKELLGDGHAILQARNLIPEGEPFLVIFGDCLYLDDEVMKKLQDAYQRTQNCVVAVQKISPSEAKHYGVVKLRDSSTPPHADAAGSVGMTPVGYSIKSLIEKPSLSALKASEANEASEASPPLALIGRYLLTPSIWPHLEKCLKESGEARLIDAMQSLLKLEPISAVEMHGQWLDTGTIEGLEKATLAFR